MERSWGQTKGRLLPRVVFVEFSFVFGSQRMHQKNTVALAGFRMAAMGADHTAQRTRIGLYPREFIHLKGTAASRVGTSLKLHDGREKMKKPMGEMFAAFILWEFPWFNRGVIEERERCLMWDKCLSIRT